MIFEKKDGPFFIPHTTCGYTTHMARVKDNEEKKTKNKKG
jgi:hypothetical protein